MFTRLLAGTALAAVALSLTPAHADGDLCVYDEGYNAIVCIPHGSGGSIVLPIHLGPG